MKIILFRSNNIFDSRVNKYKNYYERAGLDYTIVGWDRANAGLTREHYEFYNYPAGVAVGGMKAIGNHTHWMKFIYKYLKEHPDVTTVHACDLNSAFPAACFKKRCNPRLNLIFDACDWYSSQFANHKVLRLLFERMEKFTYGLSNELIICEPERKAQISFQLKKEPIVMPNIPEIDESLLIDNTNRYTFNNDWPVIAYFGGFTNDRFLVELIESAKSEHINLLIGGDGSQQIIQELKKVKDLPNIRYFGRMDMVEGLRMSSQADAIYAMYCKINSNHIFAAPNKYYEAMLLGKPLITTKGTILENKVNKNNTGYVIDESIEELRQLERRLTKNDMLEKGANARILWDNNFKAYIPNFFNNSYSKLLM
jgi:glycosyltransferase involved in cell wall biosynthesis